MQIDKLLSTTNLPLIDVRSEGEFAQGHIPRAINEPLLNNDERKRVGICYKQNGQEEAIKLGYELVEHKFNEKLQNVKQAVTGKKVGVYCWRGGLRSKIFSEILENDGLEVSRLENGYKSFRNWAIEVLALQFPLVVLGGPTGCGKTELLHLLKDKGEQVIDLEGLAKHKGSTYGGIQMPVQPTNEQFENELAIQLNGLHYDVPIWVENESRLLGKVKLPDQFYAQMRNAKVFQLEMPINIRIERILKEYAALPKEELILATAKLEKRLGNLNMNKAIGHIEKGEFPKWIEIMLGYYDKSYAHGNSLRNQHDIHRIPILDNDMNKTAALILEHYNQFTQHAKRTIDSI